MDLKALWNISYGIYVITSFSGDKMNGQIANTVFQVSA
ncbi:MAG: High molecular weight rubredoxin, partial [Deltaproteobacteria bacterium]